jgi:hypothetical protein
VGASRLLELGVSATKCFYRSKIYKETKKQSEIVNLNNQGTLTLVE